MEIKKNFQGLEFQGESTKEKNGDFILEGNLKGKIDVECIKCLNNYKKEINEQVKFKIVKPPYKGFDEEYDIIEMEKYDIEEILKSEIESIKNDYNICPDCEDTEFNKEF